MEDVELYEALFTDGKKHYTVGDFVTAKEADKYGNALHGEFVDYLGPVRRHSRLGFEKLLGTQRLARGPRLDRNRGLVTRWDEGKRYGFLTDEDGRSWFVDMRNLPGSRASLPKGTEVTFTGSPKLQPGKKYPTAYSIEVVNIPFD